MPQELSDREIDQEMESEEVSRLPDMLPSPHRRLFTDICWSVATLGLLLQLLGISKWCLTRS